MVEKYSAENWLEEEKNTVVGNWRERTRFDVIVDISLPEKDERWTVGWVEEVNIMQMGIERDNERGYIAKQ